MNAFERDTKIFQEISKHKIKCSCGHVFATMKEKDLCSWCGKYVYKNKKNEFKEKMIQEMKRSVVIK